MSEEKTGIFVGIDLHKRRLLLVGCAVTSRNAAICRGDEPLLAVTPNVRQYSTSIVAPLLASNADQDTLAQLLLVSKVLIDPNDGVAVNKMDPGKFMAYNMLSKVGLGALSTIGLTEAQKNIIRRWHNKYMHNNAADVFFAPSADEIIGTRAAFRCTHYARAFIAVVKALSLISESEDLRYVLSSKADDYNRAQESQDFRTTINGHQFVIVRIDSNWIAINTSKGESTGLPSGFDPDSCMPPHNIPIRFQAYSDTVFLLRRIGRDWDDGCGDNSFSSLMNIPRSGTPDNSAFLWEPFAFDDSNVSEQ